MGNHVSGRGSARRDPFRCGRSGRTSRADPHAVEAERCRSSRRGRRPARGRWVGSVSRRPHPTLRVQSRLPHRSPASSPVSHRAALPAARAHPSGWPLPAPGAACRPRLLRQSGSAAGGPALPPAHLRHTGTARSGEQTRAADPLDDRLRRPVTPVRGASTTAESRPLRCLRSAGCRPLRSPRPPVRARHTRTCLDTVWSRRSREARSARKLPTVALYSV